MGALARVPIRLRPLANGILIRALSSLDRRALSNIFEGDSESAYPCDPDAHSKIEGPILYLKGPLVPVLPVTCRGRPRDKCGTNGRAESSLKLDRASELGFSV